MEDKTNVEGLAYDLRQRYAIQLGDLRANILEARSKRDYITWFDLLDCLYVEIASKLDKEEKNEYNTKIKNINKVIKENWKAIQDKSQYVSSIYSSLREINIWLNGKMDDNDMFGSSETGEYGGL